jgi:hypothetical protein
MNPGEELRRLNRLLRQYETVYHTTPDPDQKDRVERQILEMRSYRDKLLAVCVIDEEETSEGAPVDDPLADFPVLVALRAQNAAAPAEDALHPLTGASGAPTAAQEEMFNLALYLRRFEREFLPFLTEKHLKLDFSHGMDRDAFYGRLQSLRRIVDDHAGETVRLAEGLPRRDMEAEVRRRIQKLARAVVVESARLFRGLGVFAHALEEDAAGDGVLCLNGDRSVAFDSIEGTRLLQGRRVAEALAELGVLADEVVAFLNVPDIEIQEPERGDRR